MLHVAFSSWYDDRQIGNSRAFVARSAWLATLSATPGLQSRDRRREERPLPLRRRPALSREERNIALERSGGLLEHANNDVVHSVDGDRPSEHTGIGREPPGPIGMGEHGEPVAVGIVRRVEQAAEIRLLPKEREVRAGHRFRRDPLRHRPVRDRDQAALIRGYRIEGRMVRFQRPVVDDREAPFVGRTIRVDPDERAWIGVRQGIHEDGPDRADHGGSRAEAEADRQHDRRRQHRHADQAANGVTHVVSEMLHGRPSGKDRADAVEQEMPGKQETLPPEPPPGGTRPIGPPAQLVELQQIALDRAPVVVADQPPDDPAHVRLSGSEARGRGRARAAGVRSDSPRPRPALPSSPRSSGAPGRSPAHRAAS